MRASVLVLLLACKRTPEAEDEERAPAKVTCKAVAKGDVEDAVEVSGVIAPPPKLDAVISSPIAGRVARVEIEEGDRVAANAVLAVIEDPALPAGSLEAKATVAAAQANKLAADQELARQERLVSSGIGAKRDLDEARAKAAAAAAELEAAKAKQGLASQQLARRELRAPHAGVVLHLWKRTGEHVDGTASTPVAEIADLSTLELRAQLPPGPLAPVREGMPATVIVAGREPLAGKVIRVSPAVDPQTLLATVRIEIAPSDAAKSLLVGSAASGRIAIATRSGIVVPAEAIRRSAAGTDEVIVCAGSKAKIAAVTIGRRSAAGIEITDGLKAGDTIVVDHVLGIEDGQALEP